MIDIDMSFVFKIIALSVVIVIVLYNLYLRSKATRCQKESAVMVEQLEMLSTPTRLFTDKDLSLFQTQIQELKNDIQSLVSSHFISREALEKRGLVTALRRIDEAPKKKEQNNTVYHSIQLIKAKSRVAGLSLDALFAPDHFFTDSERKSFEESYADLIKAFQIIYPSYEELLSSEDDFAFYNEINDMLRLRLDGQLFELENLRKEHNRKFKEKELMNNEEYFNTVLGKYPLDIQQRASIVTMEDNCLVTASAGSGKTSTILAKAKYLVEIQRIDPKKLLLLTYTRKAAGELKDRMSIDGLECSTFHGLAYRILSEVNHQNPSICSPSFALSVFNDLIFHDNEFLKAVNNYIMNLQSLQMLEHDYTEASRYIIERKKNGIQALFPDMNGNLVYTWREEEKRLCSILTCLGIKFTYRQPYEHKAFTKEYWPYKPAFTIYVNSRGRERRIYLEHFIIDSNAKVPLWYAERYGDLDTASNVYLESIRHIRKIHRENYTTLIETTSADFHNGSIEQKLTMLLMGHFVMIHRKSELEVYNLLVANNKKAQKSVYTLIQTFITLLKENGKNIDSLLEDKKQDTGWDDEFKNGWGRRLGKDRMVDLLDTILDARREGSTKPIKELMDDYCSSGSYVYDENRNKTILEGIMKPYYKRYQKTLEEKGQMDFTDCVIQATELCRRGLWQNYEYILVDEFQDISVDRFHFLQALRSENPLTKLFCVGDDWQSIFRFAGSDMSLFYEFEKYFGYTEKCRIETTYRFHQPLIDKSSAFILENPQQQYKSIKSPTDDDSETELDFLEFKDKEDLMGQIGKTIEQIPDDCSVLLLGRYNYDVHSVGYDGDLEDNEHSVMVNIGGRQVKFLSIHSAKGLEADYVFLVNCNRGSFGFPSQIEDDPILGLVLSKQEKYPYAEERRLFYVAVTRARKKAYVCYSHGRQSPFVDEFLKSQKFGEKLCPVCRQGKVVALKEGTSSNGSPYTVYGCSNNSCGCNYFERVFGSDRRDVMTANQGNGEEKHSEETADTQSLSWDVNPPTPDLSPDKAKKVKLVRTALLHVKDTVFEYEPLVYSYDRMALFGGDLLTDGWEDEVLIDAQVLLYHIIQHYRGPNELFEELFYKIPTQDVDLDELLSTESEECFKREAAYELLVEAEEMEDDDEDLADIYDNLVFKGEFKETLENYFESWTYVIESILIGKIDEKNLDSWLDYFNDSESFEESIDEWAFDHISYEDDEEDDWDDE